MTGGNIWGLGHAAHPDGGCPHGGTLRVDSPGGALGRAGAGTRPRRPGPTATVDPTSGPAGAEVTVRGTGCRHEEKGLIGTVTFGFRTQLDEPDHRLTPGDSHVDANGAWVATLAIPERMRTGGSLVEVTPGDGYSITALCVFEELGSDDWLPYDDLPFEVTASATPVRPDDDATLAPPDDSSTSRTATPSPASPINAIPTVTG